MTLKTIKEVNTLNILNQRRQIETILLSINMVGTYSNNINLQLCKVMNAINKTLIFEFWPEF